MEYDVLKLRNQLCFPIYAASRLITREYQPYLEKLELTYPQYLVMLALWEEDNITVGDIAERLILNTNTVTPLLKRLEKLRLITRARADYDERIVTIALTARGTTMKEKAVSIPEMLGDELLNSSSLSLKKVRELQRTLYKIIEGLNRE